MTFLHAIATALPRYRSSQKQALRFYERMLEATPPDPARDRVLDLARRVYAASGIETRHSVIGDWLEDDPERFTFFPKRWDLEPFPGTAQRMAMFEAESVELAVGAAAEVIARAGRSASDVTHLVISTCTGFFAPGLDVALVDRLGLAPSVRRQTLGFMGCYAGITGMRVADDIVRAHPRANVLQVAVELSTLHFQKRARPDLVVANALFADGAAAALWSGDAGGTPLASLVAAASEIAPDSRAEMTWRIGDHGFEMSLARAVPATLHDSAPGFVDRMLRSARVDRGAVRGWAIHPGGTAIVDAVARSLGLGAADVALPLEVLRDHGNMSSATIFFVLERMLMEAGGPIVALGFGPGLAVEGAVFMGLQA